MQIDFKTTYKSQRLTDSEYINQLEQEIIEKNKRIDYFVKEMDKELFKTKNPLNVLETYSKLAPYLQGRLDLEEALKQNKSYLNKNYGI